MGTNEYSQPASKSSWDSQDFGDVNMVVKMAHFYKSSRPQWVKGLCMLYGTARGQRVYKQLAHVFEFSMNDTDFFCVTVNKVRKMCISYTRHFESSQV